MHVQTACLSCCDGLIFIIPVFQPINFPALLVLALSVLLFFGFAAFQEYDWEENALSVLLVFEFAAFQEYDW